MANRAFNPPAGSFAKPEAIPISVGPRLAQTETPIVAGFIEVGAIAPDNYIVPSFDPRTNEGYQRPPQDVRINDLVNDLLKGRVDLPTAILLNIRGKDVREAVAGGSLHLSRLKNGPKKPAAPTIGDYLFHVVDGQHRIRAFHKLIQEVDADRWSKYRIPFVCMIGASEREEMEQFYTINSKAKPVRTDLAYTLLSKRVETDEDVMVALQEKGQDWIVRAQNIVQKLAETSGPWRGRVRFPGMDKGQTIIPSASMVTSLKPLLSSSYFGMLSMDQQVEILDAFWRGLRSIIVDAFDFPGNFSLQKGVGVIVWHTVLVSLIELVRSKGQSVLESDSYSSTLREPLSKLQGDDSTGTPVYGEDFWRVAPAGAAGSYSSSAGRRVLIAKIQGLLPRVQLA